MSITPQKIYDDRKDASIRPSWNKNKGYVNEEHRNIFQQTKDIPGWQMEGDSYKLYEMGYFAGDIILEIGTFGGRSAVIELKGALSNKSRRDGPRFFGIDIEMESIRRTYNTLTLHPGLIEHSLLYHGNLEAFFSDFPLQPTMVFLDGDHLYEGVKQDLDLLSQMLGPEIPVLCHDYLNPENDTGEYGVRKAATEWEDAGFARFLGVFGCSVLFVTTTKCEGLGTLMMGREEFVRRRNDLLESYGLIKGSSQGLAGVRALLRFPRRPGVHSVLSEPVPLLQWLNERPEENGIVLISEPNDFANDETPYEAEHEMDFADVRPGCGLISMLRARQADFSLPAVEIGCASGKLFTGLIKENHYPLLLLADSSNNLLNIVRDRLRHIALADSSPFHFAVLKAEEIYYLPESEFSLIAMRANLHHVHDVPKFIHDSARLLAPGGFLVFEEPCMEGYVLMGAMAQFLPLVIEKLGVTLKESHKTKIKNFVETMKYYARRDLDKKDVEDKHLFRTDEIMNIGASAGFDVEFLPNMTFEKYFEFGESCDTSFSFHTFFRDYLKHCMGFDEELIKLFEEHFRPYDQFIDDISANNNAPYCYSVFLCRKL